MTVFLMLARAMISPPAGRKRKALIGLRVSSIERTKIDQEIQKK